MNQQFQSSLYGTEENGLFLNGRDSDNTSLPDYMNNGHGLIYSANNEPHSSFFSSYCEPSITSGFNFVEVPQSTSNGNSTTQNNYTSQTVETRDVSCFSMNNGNSEVNGATVNSVPGNSMPDNSDDATSAIQRIYQRINSNSELRKVFHAIVNQLRSGEYNFDNNKQLITVGLLGYVEKARSGNSVHNDVDILIKELRDLFCPGLEVESDFLIVEFFKEFGRIIYRSNLVDFGENEQSVQVQIGEFGVGNEKSMIDDLNCLLERHDRKNGHASSGPYHYTGSFANASNLNGSEDSYQHNNLVWSIPSLKSEVFPEIHYNSLYSMPSRVPPQLKNTGLEPLKRFFLRDDSYYSSLSRRDYSIYTVRDMEFDKSLDGYICKFYNENPEYVEELIKSYFPEKPMWSSVRDIFAHFHPVEFLRFCFGSGISIDTVKEELRKLYSTGDYKIPKNHFYDYFVIHRYIGKANSLFNHLSFLSVDHRTGITLSDLANASLESLKYKKSSAPDCIYDNCGREKLAKVLQFEPKHIKQIENLLEAVAEDLGIMINGERVSLQMMQARKTIGLATPRRQTWNSKPSEVKERLYLILIRILWDSLRFRHKAVSMIVKRCANSIAQNKFKSKQNKRKNDGLCLNPGFRKNIVKSRRTSVLGKR